MKGGAPLNLFLDISPNYINTSFNEPCEVENQIVLQVRNSSTESVTLHNDSNKTDFSFKPIDEATDIPGLSMIYFVFKLGSNGECLTTAEQFYKTSLLCQDGFQVARVGADTLVLFPRTTADLPANGQTELVIQGLITTLPAGQPSTCRVKFFNVSGQDSENTLPVNKNRHPLTIPKFELAAGDEIASFRDYIRFYWLALGADTCVFTPGDVSLADNSQDDAEGEHLTLLQKRTMFTLVASQGDRKISKSCEIIPLLAEIVDFTVSCEKAPSEDFLITLKFTVKHTRHAFINRLGRVKAESNVEQTVTVLQKQKPSSYTLTVENENCLTQKTCYL